MMEQPIDLGAEKRAARRDAKLELLDYLIGIAQDTHGSEVWRALFAEIRRLVQEGF